MDWVACLGYVVLANGILVDSSKIEVMLEWQRPKIDKRVQSFLGLVGYYRQFIKGFVKLALLLTDLTYNNVPFIWFYSCEESF